MIKVLLFVAGVAAGLVMLGSASTDSWAAQLDATVNPNQDTSEFKMSYLKTIHIWYEDGGVIADELRGLDVDVAGSADSSNADVQALIERLNTKILQSGSYARVSDLDVEYTTQLVGNPERATIDYRVVLQGTLVDYVITKDTQKTLVDLGWRGLTVDDSVVINGQEINDPFVFVQQYAPETFDTISGTNAEIVFDTYIINADFILEQPLENWHFLFDPTGINQDASTFGLGEELAGLVVSRWTMGESSFREGRQVEQVVEETLVADREYVVKSIRSPDLGSLNIIGFGVIDLLDGVEIAGVTPTAPEGYGNTATGDFPIFIIYGMAGLAAVAGIAFFFVSNRSLKNEAQGQQGVDPAHLVGYQTSAASGGYQTNRGEAQLRDGGDYQKTRSYYESDDQAPPRANDSPTTRRSPL